MNKRLFPRMAFCLTLITSFLFMPFSAVYADGYNQNTDYWRWWYVENITDKVSDGQGASADGITDTYNGSTVGQYVYDTTGITSDDVKEYVQQQYENATEYVEHTAEWYSSAIDDIWNSTIDAGTKAKYLAEKAIRETVDTAGNTILDVSSSDYWSNVYNDIFNSGAYKPQYSNVSNSGVNGTYNGNSFNVSCIGIVKSDDAFYNQIDSTPYTTVFRGITCYSSIGHLYEFGETISSGYYANVWEITVNGNTCYASTSGYSNTRTAITYNYDGYETTYYYINIQFRGPAGEVVDDAKIYFNGNVDDIGSNTNPVLQPNQVGFVFHNGIKFPVYTDPTLNPFKVNDDGTVTWNDGTGDEHIYIDPTQLTDDGSLDILEWLDNENLTENPYNPQGKPWNTHPDGSVLGGFFSNLIKDISSIFDGIGKMISDLIDKIIKAIKDIANIIIDALKQFWNLLIGDIEEYPSLFETDVDDNFDMISDLYDLLLECMGVDA